MLAIAALALAGVVVSSVSLYHHYGTSATSYCDIGENFNCDIVNRSTFSTVAGVPVALIGIAGYLVVLTLATLYRNHADVRRDVGDRFAGGARLSHFTLPTSKALFWRRGVFCACRRWR